MSLKVKGIQIKDSPVNQKKETRICHTSKKELEVSITQSKNIYLGDK